MAEVERMWMPVDLGDEVVTMQARRSQAALPLAPPVVIVHGLAISSRYAEPLVAELGALFDVYAPDLPGFGGSRSLRPPADLPAMADHLARFIEAAGLAQVSLFGHSFGCHIAVECARRHPRRVRRLVLHAPIGEPAITAPRQVLRYVKNARREPLLLGPLIARDVVRTGARRAMASFRTSLAEPLLSRASQISQPALVVGGERDPIASPAWTERVAAAIRRGEYVCLPGVAHAALYSHPRALAGVAAPGLAEPNEALPRAWSDHRAPPPGPAGDGPPPAPIEERDRAMACLAATAAAVASDHPRARAPRRRPPRRARMPELCAESVAAWAVSQYPQRSYPAVVFGPGCGPLAYLAAALGAPFLPHSFPLSIAPPGRVDADPARAAVWSRELASEVLPPEPGIELKHVVDTPPQGSRLRVVLSELPGAYFQALCERLDSGGAVVIVDCRLRWPTIQLGDRHGVQLAGPGAGSEAAARVERALVAGWRAQAARLGDGPRSAPPTPVLGPEAQWGIDEGMADMLRAVATSLGAPVVTIQVREPYDLAALVAECIARWYWRAGSQPRALLGEFDSQPFPRWSERSRTVPLAPPELSARAGQAFSRLSHLTRWHALGAIARDGEQLDAWIQAAPGAARAPGWVRGPDLEARRAFCRDRFPPLPRLCPHALVADVKAAGSLASARVEERAPLLPTTRPAS